MSEGVLILCEVLWINSKFYLNIESNLPINLVKEFHKIFSNSRFPNRILHTFHFLIYILKYLLEIDQIHEKFFEKLSNIL